MSGRRRADDDEPATRADIRKLLARLDEMEGNAINGMEADHRIGYVETDLREFRERFEEVVDYLLDLCEDGGSSAELEVDPRIPKTSRLDVIARAYLDSHGPDGTPPTPEHLARVLGMSERWLRTVGWSRIEARAAALDVQ